LAISIGTLIALQLYHILDAYFLFPLIIFMKANVASPHAAVPIAIWHCGEARPVAVGGRCSMPFLFPLLLFHSAHC
jgi:hypothetical protein